jgi:hypothetical protein
MHQQHRSAAVEELGGSAALSTRGFAECEALVV